MIPPFLTRYSSGATFSNEPWHAGCAVEPGRGSMLAEDRSVVASHIDMEKRIRARAYQIYLDRGGQPGSALEDWLEAERQVLGESTQPAQDRGTTVGSARRPGETATGMRGEG
jgi:hypothetical protein